ncbi:MAG: ComEC/Rec2 family competence protein [Lentisphaerae bacterium]|nr:ComEC/Rec2 family competence protein [Lentisphaerota bacterium]
MHTHPVRRQPIIGIACLLIIGTGAGLRAGASLALPLAIACAVAALAVAAYGAWRSGLRGGIAVAATVCCAGFLSGFLSEWTRRDERAWLAAHATEPVQVRGVVDSDAFTPYRPPGATRRVISLRRVVIEHAGGVRPLTQTPVRVTCYGRDLLPKVGETWSFPTPLSKLRTRPKPTHLPVNTRPGDAVLLEPPAFWDWRPLADRARASAVRRLSLGIESWPTVPTLIHAMLLGLRSDIPPEMNTIFRNSGTMHVFAISGQGIGLVAAVLAAGLSFLAFPRTRWGLTLIPLLFGYTLLTGASSSAMRACLMAAFYFGAPLVRRKPDLSAALAAAAIIQIAWDPRDLLSIGFLLSYTVMAGLVLLCPPLSRLFRALLRVESAATQAALLRLSERLTQQRQRFARQAWAVRLALWRHATLGFFADLLAMGVAAWVASAPLIAYFFERFIPGGLLANLVVVPAAGLIVVAGALAILTSFLFPSIAGIFNCAAAFCTAVMVEASRLTTLIPGASVIVPPPSLALIVVWYAAMLAAAWMLHTAGQAEKAEHPF